MCAHPCFQGSCLHVFFVCIEGDAGPNQFYEGVAPLIRVACAWGVGECFLPTSPQDLPTLFFTLRLKSRPDTCVQVRAADQYQLLRAEGHAIGARRCPGNACSRIHDCLHHVCSSFFVRECLDPDSRQLYQLRALAPLSSLTRRYLPCQGHGAIARGRC